MNKKFLFMLGILFLGVGVAFAANEISNILCGSIICMVLF